MSRREIERADGTTANIRETGQFLGFTLAMGLPSWRYEIDGITLEKSVVCRRATTSCTSPSA
jgi:hypothetical protein